MANYYSQLNCASVDEFCSTLKSALVAKYGNDGVTVHNEKSPLIFTCPAISDFVISINRNNGYYGTAYTSGTNIENSVRFLTLYDSISEARLVLGDSFLFMTGIVTGNHRFVFIVAKTIGGKSVVSGAYSYEGYGKNCVTREITTGQDISFVDFGGLAVWCNTNTPYKSKLLLAYATAAGDQILRNSDGSVDTIDGLYMSTYANTNYEYVGANNAVLSARNLYYNGSVIRLRNSILAEF